MLWFRRVANQSCCLFHSVVHSSSVLGFSLRHSSGIGGLRTLKAAAVDTLFVIFFGL